MKSVRTWVLLCFQMKLVLRATAYWGLICLLNLKFTTKVRNFKKNFSKLRKNDNFLLVCNWFVKVCPNMFSYLTLRLQIQLFWSAVLFSILEWILLFKMEMVPWFLHQQETLWAQTLPIILWMRCWTNTARNMALPIRMRSLQRLPIIQWPRY